MEKKGLKTLLAIFLMFVSLLMIVPFFLMISTSLKTMGEILSPHNIFVPQKPMFENYIAAFTRGEWPRYFYNTFVITLFTVAISLVINSIAGYSFARLEFKGRDKLFIISLIGLMIPPQATMIPVFLILKHFPLAGGNNILGQGGLGFVNSYFGIMAPYLAGSFGVFLFRQYFLNFPKSLDDAAKIDGLGKLQTFIRIYAPLSKPVFASLLALKATQGWNEYTWPLIMTTSDTMRTVQLALTIFKDDAQTEWNLLMAATTVIIMPLLITFIFTQKYFIQGIVTTGIKG